jgi:hypothetical protein
MIRVLKEPGALRPFEIRVGYKRQFWEEIPRMTEEGSLSLSALEAAGTSSRLFCPFPTIKKLGEILGVGGGSGPSPEYSKHTPWACAVAKRLWDSEEADHLVDLFISAEIMGATFQEVLEALKKLQELGGN